ncbi:hypothetical protein V493_07622, partial [Pseudogymnoascus sp. VKM F-4281 (FW-2241)]
MTLFGNILQNPQDPRARSDVRLMNLVVNFLSMLAGEDENTGVKRMLGVCAEFERIARVVLDKADRDTTTRRKRKELDNEVLPNLSVSRPPMARQAPASAGQTPPAQFGGGAYGEVNTYSSGADGGGGVPAQDLSWMADANFDDIATDFEHLSNAAAAANGGNGAGGGGGGGGGPGVGMPFPDISRFLTSADPHSPINPQSFQQPFVPPDLWQMPMTLEWDWADLT